MKQYRMGVLGAGNMASAIADGVVRAGMLAAGDILMFNRAEQKRAEKAGMGYAVTDDFTKTYTDCDWTLLGIKPQNFSEILPKLNATGENQKPLLISIAAGVTFSQIEKALGENCPIVRVMPNTPLMLGRGASALVGNHAASTEQVEAIRALFGVMGVTVVFPKEDMLNEVIPYNGSLPAYVYAFIDAMTCSAVEHGIERESALQLICQTCIGSAEMVRKGDKTPAQLIDAVCSPGGTTLEAMKVLREKGFASLLAEASNKCIARAYELGNAKQ